jgi:hypothetical protein
MNESFNQEVETCKILFLLDEHSNSQAIRALVFLFNIFGTVRPSL